MRCVSHLFEEGTPTCQVKELVGRVSHLFKEGTTSRQR